MSTTVKTGWLHDNNGDKFAPKTLSSQIITNEGILFEEEIQSKIDNIDGGIEITKAEYDKLGDSVLTDGKTYFIKDLNIEESGTGSNIASDIVYDNTESGLESNNIQDAIDEIAASVKGIVIDVTTDSWDIQEDGTYKKVIAVDGLTGNEVLDVCLDPSYSHTEEQITAFSESVTTIETARGRIILTASEAITVEFSILLYGKVGFNVCSENGGSSNGGGNANIIKLTQSEYNALPESKNSDGILYAITDGECSASSGSSKPVELTKAEYEALGDKVNSDGILYAITDGDGLSAKSMAFDDTETQLGVNNVQDAIVEQNKNLDFSGDYTGYGIWCIGNYGNCYLIVPLPIPSNVKANYNVNVTFVGLGGLTSSNLEMKDYSVSVYSGMLMINCAEALNTIKDTNFTHLGNVAFTVTKKS